LKQNPPDLLLKAIRSVLDGGIYIDPALRNFALTEPVPKPSGEAATSRQQAIWNGVVQGLTNKEISNQFHISEPAVKIALRQLFER
jgi:DNA-binding NarL/FixJ family response regulator